MTTTTLREFTRLSMDTYDYPSLQIEEFGGIPQNTRYNYVSESFLNGLVNYGDNHVGFLLARYGIAVAHAPTDASKPHGPEHYLPLTEAAYQEYANTASRHPHFQATGDDWLIYYETRTSYFHLWYDRDCSTCTIERFSKDDLRTACGIDTLESFIEAHTAEFRQTFFDGDGVYPGVSTVPVKILVRAAHPLRGWIRW